MAASKEATVYVVDVGKSMGLRNHGREETDLELSLKFVWDKITTAMALNRKGLMSGVIAFRADDTNNKMPSEESYEHISVLQEIQQTLMPDVRKLNNELKPSGTDDGDVISAIVTAGEMIQSHCKQLKYIKRIYLITNGTSMLDDAGLEVIMGRLKEIGVQLFVLGVDFDDSESGYKEEDKDEHKAQNERALRRFTEACGGEFGSLAEALSLLEIPRLKSVKPVKSYGGFLSLGDPENYETAMCIDVERYPRTMPVSAPSASTFAVRSGPGTDEAQDVDMDNQQQENFDNDLVATERKGQYQIKDEDAPGGKRDIEAAQRSRGFEYGRTVIPVSEHDRIVLSMETKASFEILGFIPTSSHPHYMNMSKTNIVVAQATNDKAVMALSSLINALYELDSHAVARLVTKDNRSPSLVLLSYGITKDQECLFENELPFHEDIRGYKFPPLDHILTVSGKTLKVHRNLPNDDLQNAMDDLVDQMDLSQFERDDDGNPSEYLAMDDSYSPRLHRLNQVIKYRAVHPGDAIPEPYSVILKAMRPPEDLLENIAPCLERLKAAADVKKVPAKATFRKSRRNAEQPRSGLDVSALLDARVESNGRKINPSNAIPEFKQLMGSTGESVTIDEIREVITQFGTIIQDWIRESFGDSKYDKALEALGTMRQECIEMEEPSCFNDYLRALKGKLLAEELNGDRKEMWYKVRNAKLGLIQKRESGQSEVEDDEARLFWSTR